MKLLSSITEIGTSLFTTLEVDFSVPIADQRSQIQEQHKVLSERLSNTVKLPVSSETVSLEDGQARKSQVSAWSKINKISLISYNFILCPIVKDILYVINLL